MSGHAAHGRRPDPGSNGWWEVPGAVRVNEASRSASWPGHAWEALGSLGQRNALGEVQRGRRVPQTVERQVRQPRPLEQRLVRAPDEAAPAEPTAFGIAEIGAFEVALGQHLLPVFVQGVDGDLRTFDQPAALGGLRFLELQLALISSSVCRTESVPAFRSRSFQANPNTSPSRSPVAAAAPIGERLDASAAAPEQEGGTHE